MLKAGLLPSPIIIPLSSNSLAAKNKIHTQTFIELRSDIPDVRIFFTVDGSKPDLSQISRTGNSSPTHFYRGAFRLEPGKRIVKAIAVTSDGLRESHITTKYFDVNDMYEAYSDNEQYIPENNDDQSKPHFDRSTWNENFNTHRSTSPVQGNFSSPIKDNRYEHMREQRIPPPPPPVEPVRYLEVTTHEEENFWDRKSTPLSSGNGNWKKTLEHLFINIYNYVKNEQQLREIFGWKKFGRMETTRVIDKGGTYHVVSIFKKPLGEQSSYEQPPTPVRKHRRKKHRRTPPPPSHDIEDEKSSRRTHSPVHREQSIHDENEDKRAPRIYTEEIEEQGTLIPYPDFNADADTEALHKSVNDENIIIEILGNRTCDQRMKIRERYRTKYNRDFDADLNTHDTNESFRNIIKQLFYSPVEYDCYELQRGIKGLDANQEVLIEILATRSNKRIQAINNLYPKLFDQTLENEIVNNTNGYFKKLLIALLNNQRPETNQINENNIRNDAKSLYEAGDNKWTDEPSKFIQIVCNRSDVQLKAIFETYRQYSKRDLEADIQAETSGDLRKSLLTIVRIMRNRPGYFAYRFKKNLKAANTDENDLNRIVISRCEIDMVQIKNEYEHTMQHSLDEDIKHNKNEDYQHILLELIKDPNQRTRTERPKKQKSKSGDEPTYEQPEIYHEEIIQQGTMIPARNFDPNGDAEALRKAMKGVGTDEKVLISILGNRTTSQRLEIKSAFKKKFNRDLLADLKSETSGNFCKLLERLMMDPIELDCFELKEAVKGVGTDEEALIEILASRSNERIKSINETYRKMYSKSLEKDVKSDTSGDFRRLLVSLLQGQRPETTEVNMGEVKHDAQALVEAGKGKFQTDNAKFNSLYCERSDPQLKAIFNEFSKINGKSIEDVIKKETSGDHQKALLATIKCIQSRPDFFAERLKKSIEGVGTRESILNRILITRSEIDLVQIKLSYKNLFKRELEKDVSGDTSGDYKKLLLEILKDPSQRN